MWILKSCSKLIRVKDMAVKVCEAIPWQKTLHRAWSMKCKFNSHTENVQQTNIGLKYTSPFKTHMTLTQNLCFIFELILIHCIYVVLQGTYKWNLFAALLWQCRQYSGVYDTVNTLADTCIKHYSWLGEQLTWITK
jgi:hypothetical protein